MKTSFDDGAKLDLRLAELLDKYNLQATFYIPGMWESYGTVKGWEPLSYEDVKYLSEHFTIGAHGLTHALLTKIPISVAEYEIYQSKILLEDLFDLDITSFCYPRGYASGPIKDVTRRYYDSARSTLVGSIDEAEDPLWEHTTVHVCCQRDEYMGKNWLDFAYDMLKKAQTRKNAVYHVWGHSHEIERNQGWKGVEELFSVLAGLQ